MITKELIAKAICQYGHCEKCDEDCVDYRAAMRVMKAIEKEKLSEVDRVLTDLETEVSEHSVHWSYQPRAALLNRIVDFKEKQLEVLR